MLANSFRIFVLASLVLHLTVLRAEERAIDVKADLQRPDPSSVLLAAQQSRHTWRNLPGFTATVKVSDGAGSVVTQIGVDANCQMQVTGAVPLPEWASPKIRSLLSHRRYRPPESESASYVIGSESHIYGPAILKEDGSGQFRIVDNALREVVRRSDDSWLEIDTVKVLLAEDGENLPEISIVNYREPQTGDLKSSRTNYYTWTRLEDFYLPLSVIEIELTAGGGKTCREIAFSDHRLGPVEDGPGSASAISLDSSNSSSIVPPADSISPPARLHRSLREPITSFGAAVLGDYLYVFSGHDGVAHSFGKDILSPHFRRIRFDDPQADWEDLPMHAPAQSVAIVTDGTYLYRIGGLSFLNESGDEETNYNSTTHFARYDTEAQTWTDLVPLPEPRSSLDAAVLGRHIYVAGGWNLQGSSTRDAPWAETMLRYDLDHPEAGWETLPGPGYKSRAISLAAHENKIYFVGGISTGGVLRKVSVWDSDSATWSSGPELPADSSTAGFATSSFATGGRLYVTGGSGVIYRLSADGDTWEIANRLFFPRMFLRLLPADSHRLIAVGGTGSGGSGRMAVVESINVDPNISQPYKLASWSIDFGGRAKHSQSLALVGNGLYAFGGNASRMPHDFSEEAFVDEAFAFNIPDRWVEELPRMPSAMQSGVAVVNRQTSEHQTIAVAGGIGFDGAMTSLDAVHLFDPAANTWAASKQKLPQPRSMFEAVAFGDAIWSVGGASGTGSALLTNILHWWGDDSAITALPNVSLPTPRRSFASAKLDSELFLIGGLGQGNEIAAQVDVFHFDQRSWRTVASPNIDRVFPSATVSDGKIYLFGGFSMSSGHFAPASSLEVYDPATDLWTVVAEQLPEVPPSMRMLAYNNRLLFFGVDKQQDGKANFVLFDPNPLAAPNQVAAITFGGQSRSGEKYAETARMLMRRDIDKDGKLSIDELGSKLSHLLVGDQDGDSALSLEELTAALKADAEAKESAESSDSVVESNN